MKQVKKDRRTYSVDFFVMLVVFLIYAGAMLLLVYMGTGVYRSVTSQMERHYSTRTAQAYITEKIRQNDSGRSISAEEFEGKSALVFRENVGEKVYVTYIYEDDGQLKELLTRENSQVSLDGGTSLLDLQEFQVRELEDGGFSICLTEKEGNSREFIVYQDSEGQEAKE